MKKENSDYKPGVDSRYTCIVQETGPERAFAGWSAFMVRPGYAHSCTYAPQCPHCTARAKPAVVV